jgi:type I restriction enzyme, S subunit
MKQEWKQRPIGELCKLINGRAFKPSEWASDGLRIVRIQNLNDPSKKYNLYNGHVKEKHIIDIGDILISWSGTPGTSFGCFIWDRGQAVLNQHIFKVEVDNNLIDDEFFMFSVNSQLDEMIDQAHGGVGLRHITKGKLEAIKLPVPTLSEQLRVVKYIKECRQSLEEIRQLKRTLIKDGYDLIFSTARDYYQSASREYRKCLLKEVSIINPTRPKLLIEKFRNKKCSFVPMRAVDSIAGQITNSEALPFMDVQRGYTYFEENDVIFAKITPCMQNGKSSIAQNLLNGIGFGSTEFHVIRPTETILKEWLFYFLRLPEIRDDAKNNFRGSAGQQRVPASWLENLEIPIPPIDIQSKLIIEMNTAVNAAIDIYINTQGNHEIDHLDKSILQKAFSGEF